jgi:hypothetical protein
MSRVARFAVRRMMKLARSFLWSDRSDPRKLIYESARMMAMRQNLPNILKLS